MNIFFSSAICDVITYTLRGYMHSLAVSTFRTLYGLHTMRCIDYIHASRDCILRKTVSLKYRITSFFVCFDKFVAH